MFLPPSGEGFVAPPENIALGPGNVGDSNRIGGARAEVAFAIAGVLPEAPVAPGRRHDGLVMIIGDPEPAIGERRFVGATDAGRV
jgi:hypothetical protein